MKQISEPMRVVIRTDASLQIGTGHVMRCLTLAAGLANHGARVDFICRTHEGNLKAIIEKRGFGFIPLTPAPRGHQTSSDLPAHAHWLGCDWQTDARQCNDALVGIVDWIIVDHYALDQQWETAMRHRCVRIMCIDDLADRPHDCDLLLDQNLGRCTSDYAKLLPTQAQLLLGPKYALLRPEFPQWRNTSLARRKSPKLHHILVTLGGVDADNVTGRVLKVLRECNVPTLEMITVVLGPHAPWRDKVLSQAAKIPTPTQVLSGVDNMAELMTSCDLAIGASGSTTWERCALGVPTIQIELAMNQIFINSAVRDTGVALAIGVKKLEHELSALLLHVSKTETLKNLSSRSAAVTDGLGVETVLAFFLSR